MTPSNVPTAHTPSNDDGLPLLPLLWDIWQQRWVVGIGLGVVTALYLAVAALVYLRTPADVTGQVEIRFTFDGADRNQYPNGTPFSRSDLLATPVLTEVYRVNDLERYLPFEQFREALFVLESNVALELLGYEYQARLSDSRLPAIERSRLETEFKQKRDSQSVPQVYLRFTLSERRASIPKPVVEKVLNDVLAVWARQAGSEKGSLLYQLELITPNVILQDTLNTQTSLIRYDLLRRHVGRALQQLGTVGKLPGASTIRVGKDKLSLTDLSTNLVDLLEFHLNPMIRRRLIYALTPAEAQLNVLYLQDRVLELQRVRQTAETRRAQLQAALLSFTAEQRPQGATAESPAAGTVSTQLSDSFLDRLFDIAGQSGGVEFREDLTNRIISAGEQGLAVEQDIAFYQESLRLLREAMGGMRPDALRPEDVVKAFAAIQTQVVETITLTGDAYERISSAALNPSGSLFNIVGPFSVRSVSGVSLRQLAVGLAAVLIIALALLIAGVLARAALRRQQARSSTGTRSGDVPV